MDESRDDQEGIERLVEEFILASEEGNAPSVDDFARKAGDRADLFRERIRTYLKADQALREIGAALPAAAPSPHKGPTGYRIVRELGRGGMGVVYLAEQLNLQRQVAVKALNVAHASDPSYAERFLREGKAIAALRHDNIVRVIDVVSEDGALYLILEHIDGLSLDRILTDLKKKRLGEITAADVRSILQGGTDAAPSGEWAYSTDSYFGFIASLMRDVADAVRHAHAKGIVHRDIKPSNILMDKQGKPHLADFGLARLEGGPALTRGDTILGTPQYLAPEQVAATSGSPDERTDVYAIGVALYESLALHPPFTGETTARILHAIVNTYPAPLRKLNPHVPRDLAAITEKAMSRHSKDRYPSAEKLASDLKSFLAHRAVEAKPLSTVVRMARQAKKRLAHVTLAILALVSIAAGYRYWKKWKLGVERLDQINQEKASHEQKDRAKRDADRLLCEALHFLSDRERSERLLREARALHTDPAMDLIESLQRIMTLAQSDWGEDLSKKRTQAAEVIPQKYRGFLESIGTLRQFDYETLVKNVNQHRFSGRELILLSLLGGEDENIKWLVQDLRDRALATAPDDVVVMMLAIEYSAAFSGEKPSQIAEGAIQLRPDISVLYIAAANALRTQSKTDRARKILETGLDRHPEDGDLLAAIGRLEAESYLDPERRKKAPHYLERALRARPGDTELVLRLGNLYLEIGDEKKLEELLNLYAGCTEEPIRFLRAHFLACGSKATRETRSEAAKIIHELSFQPPTFPLQDLPEAARFAWVLGEKGVSERVAKIAQNYPATRHVYSSVERSKSGSPIPLSRFVLDSPSGCYVEVYQTEYGGGVWMVDVSLPLSDAAKPAKFHVSDHPAQEVFNEHVRQNKAIPVPGIPVIENVDIDDFKIEGVECIHHRLIVGKDDMRLVGETWHAQYHGRYLLIELTAHGDDHAKLIEKVAPTLSSLRVFQPVQKYKGHPDAVTLQDIWVDEFNGIRFPYSALWEPANNTNQSSYVFNASGLSGTGFVSVTASSRSARELFGETVQGLVNLARETSKKNLGHEPNFEPVPGYLVQGASKIDARIAETVSADGGKLCWFIIGIEHDGRSFFVTSSCPIQMKASRMAELSNMLKGIRFFEPNRLLELNDWGCRLQIPTEWRQSDNGSDPAFREFIRAVPSSSGLKQAGVTIENFPGGLKEHDARSFLLKRAAITAADLKILKEKTVEKDGRFERNGEITYTRDGVKRRSLVRLVEVSGNTFFLEGYAPAEAFDAVQEELRAVIGSFREYVSPSVILK